MLWISWFGEKAKVKSIKLFVIGVLIEGHVESFGFHTAAKGDSCFFNGLVSFPVCLVLIMMMVYIGRNMVEKYGDIIMFLSIIIPVYNSDEYLAECLDSCLNQNIASNDYEIICVNDGSTDSSYEILEKYSEKHHNIRFFSQENRGVSVARNIGLENAKGQYVMFVDSDDIIRSNILYDLKSVIEREKCNRLHFGGYVGSAESINEKQSQDFPPNIFNDLLVLNLYNRTIIDSNNIRFIEGLTYSEDILFLSDFNNFDNNVSSYERTVYYYRAHKGSVSDWRNTNALRKILNSIIMILSLCKKRMTEGIFNKETVFAFWLQHYNKFFRLVSYLPFSQRKDYLRELKRSQPNLTCRIGSDARLKEKKLYRKIRRETAKKKLALNIYASSLGAHMIYFIYQTKMGQFLRHPRKKLRQIIEKKK